MIDSGGGAARAAVSGFRSGSAGISPLTSYLRICLSRIAYILLPLDENLCDSAHTSELRSSSVSLLGLYILRTQRVGHLGGSPSIGYSDSLRTIVCIKSHISSPYGRDIVAQ